MRSNKYSVAKFVLVLGTITTFITHLIVHETGKVSYSQEFVDHTSEDDNDEYLNSTQSRMEYLIDTSTCKLPKISPFDPSILDILKPIPTYECDRLPRLTYVSGNKLIINKTASEKFSYCKYRPINRPQYVEDHNFYRLGPESDEFSSSRDVSDDFIKIKCYSTTGGLMYINYHQFIHQKKNVELRCSKLFRRHLKSSKNKDKLSVLMIGVDSTSRLNFMRYMNQTRNFLLQELEAIDLMGYNKVADNTFVNIVPMTMGKFLEEVPWNETLSDKPFDKYNFIWKQFSHKGYRTLYSEDKPELAIFDYLKSGFHQAPADYFNRHFTLAMDQHYKMWYHDENCIGDRLETEIMLQYIERFVTTFKFRPYFSFSFITGLTHDTLEGSAKADLPYQNFLERLTTSGSLNRTIIFFFSDHGLRFGDIRSTYVGKMEERLPFMFLAFPKWFRAKYPNIMKNLKINQNRLTTPFDIYQTLRNILNFKGEKTLLKQSKEQRGISLFNEIPEDRTCETAGILPHWCTCIQHVKLPENQTSVRVLAANIVMKINEYLENYKHICEHLSVKSVTNAVKLVLSDEVLRFKESRNDVINRRVKFGEKVKAYVDYQLTLVATPGGGTFEATIRHNEIEDSYEMMSDISRIDLYGDQSHCISSHTLKKFCYCKSQLKS